MSAFFTSFFLLISLLKDYLKRPNYLQLLNHAFLLRHSEQKTDASSFFQQVLDLPDDEPKTKKKA